MIKVTPLTALVMAASAEACPTGRDLRNDAASAPCGRAGSTKNNTALPIGAAPNRDVMCPGPASRDRSQRAKNHRTRPIDRF
jgi:hypothetical protein